MAWIIVGTVIVAIVFGLFWLVCVGGGHADDMEGVR